LRSAEEGRQLLQAGDYASALLNLEKALRLDLNAPSVYFYLASAHFHLANHEESLNFLEVAASRLQNSPQWMSEILALQKRTHQALAQRARDRQARIGEGGKAAEQPKSVPKMPAVAALSFLLLLLGSLVFAAVSSPRLKRLWQ
jgi:tetratricopeptide (TPR) repeat protein